MELQDYINTVKINFVHTKSTANTVHDLRKVSLKPSSSVFSVPLWFDYSITCASVLLS